MVAPPPIPFEQRGGRGTAMANSHRSFIRDEDFRPHVHQDDHIHPLPPPPFPTSFFNGQFQPPPPPQSSTRLLGDPQQSHCYNFARIAFLLSAVIIVAMSLVKIITWFIYGSGLPVFHVQRLDMPVFNITNNATLNARWNANILIQNPNHKFEVMFDHLELTLLYKDYVLDISSATQLHLGRNERKNLYVEFNTTRTTENVMDVMWFRDMGNEGSKGFLDFDLNINLEAAFKSGTGWSKSTSLRVLCDDLEVKLRENMKSDDGMNGNGDVFKDCLLL